MSPWPADGDAARLLDKFGAPTRLRHPHLGRCTDALFGRAQVVFVVSERASVSMTDVLRASQQGAAGSVASCVQLAGIPLLLLRHPWPFFQAVPASVALPLYPRHYAGEALLSRPDAAEIVPVDLAWKVGDAHRCVTPS
ncbi:unnamed protein product [Prorocentrum cordatum]|uniref:Lipid-A-disaccharide synthase n=1 Tax=Prorocentrum cordatum TaxID=2364126 RepID=A0ABN9TWR3_9DINO|nr:unnamed protein product [Polarella glacialis]